MTRLDTRAARGDLTSRECCKIISGVLFGAASYLPVESLRAVLMAARVKTVPELEAQTELLKQVPLVVLSILGAVLGALSEQAAPGAMNDAIDWILERGDEYWAALKTGADHV